MSAPTSFWEIDLPKAPNSSPLSRGRMLYGCLAIFVFLIFSSLSGVAWADATIAGRVEANGGPLANSAVSVWAAGPAAPRKLTSGVADGDGQFRLDVKGNSPGEVLYMVARGGQPRNQNRAAPSDAIALIAIVGSDPPEQVVINELSTVASVWTSAQFLDGESLMGNALGLRIAAGNVANLVDLRTGGLGPVIQDPLNSNLTTTLATFSTLGDLLAGCIGGVVENACARLFAAATPPGGAVPKDTLAAAQAIARHPWQQPDKLFALFNEFYPPAAGGRIRKAPFLPYLSFSPGDWTLSLTYAGGGLNSLGGIAIDAEGNAWAANNFIVGSQSTLYDNLGGGVSKLAPNGRPLSPMTLGYRGGGVDLPGFGLAIGADGRVWVDSLGSKTISLFSSDGKPLSPDTGYNLGGKLGAMQGIITTPSGDVWALDNDKSQLVLLPKGDPSHARLLCGGPDSGAVIGACKVAGPFHLAVDQQDRIWITNGNAETVTRFPSSDPGKAETLKVGLSPKGIAIDSAGNAWVNNFIGDPGLREKLELLKQKGVAFGKSLIDRKASGANPQIALFHDLFNIALANPGGNLTLLGPDGTEVPGSPFNGGGSVNGPWGIAIDGNDNVWVVSALGHSVTELCGVRVETCPPGHRTGDPISPPQTGYRGHGLQVLTDIAIDQAGNVWVANNWDLWQQGFMQDPDPALSTRFGGNGFVVFFGLAKPVAAPLVGPPRSP